MKLCNFRIPTPKFSVSHIILINYVNLRIHRYLLLIALTVVESIISPVESGGIEGSCLGDSPENFPENAPNLDTS